ncbi:hypothetical protein [Nocardiopsis xinjiangensis]|uniref:hypothetical protein n=1 Tax=Nocardiopsis xinjiangensis TaxID=124285 RepID=UPI001268878C|nr:hypothetical protein [Nocardiopsis xinjiangensis]
MKFPFPSTYDRVTLLTDWAALHRPEAVHTAEAALERMHSQLMRAASRSADFLSFMDHLANSLPTAFLPWFWDSITQGLLLVKAPKATRAAPKAHAKARQAEADWDLPIDPEHHMAQTLFVARHGVLPAKDVRSFQGWVTQALPPEQAYTALVDLTVARAQGGSAPAANTHTLLGKAAQAAGVGAQEQARLLARVLTASRGTAVPPALHKGAAKVLAATPLPAGDLAGLWELFPPGRWSRNDGSAWLNLLEASGALDALVRGEITPEEGVSGWLQRFCRLHKYVAVRHGMMAASMPGALHRMLPRLAPRLQAENRPLDTWSSEADSRLLDSQLLGHCLALDIPVQMPSPARPFEIFMGGQARHVIAHPELGPRLERQISDYHYVLERSGFRLPDERRSAMAMFPDVPELRPMVRRRLDRLRQQLEGSALPQATNNVQILDDLLDQATITAFPGIEEELQAVDPVGPLIRSLRSGLPEELGWSAFDAAVTDLGGPDAVLRVCPSWPVLTLVGYQRAIAVDHAGRLGECELDQDDGQAPVVRYLDGRFLIASADKGPERARWSDQPGTVFTPDDEQDSETADWARENFYLATGEWTGYRLVPTRDRHRLSGQMSDGTTVWLSEDRIRSQGWQAWTGDGIEEEYSLPAFFDGGPGQGRRWESEHLSLVPLPEGVVSPFGQTEDGLSGFRVSQAEHRPAPHIDDYLIEGADGRRCHFERKGRAPWALMRFPGTGIKLLVDEGPGSTQGREEMRCHAAEDDALWWQVRTAPVLRRWWTTGEMPFYPPVGYWHFLTLRDPASSEVLRDIDTDRARALLDAFLEGGRDGALKALDTLLPGVEHEWVQEGVVRAVAATEELLRGRRALVERIRTDRAALAEAP